MFGRNAWGAIRVVCAHKVVVNARFYDQPTGAGEAETKGQYFAGMPKELAIGLGETTQVLGVYQIQPAAESEHRYNFGFVETTGRWARVRVTAWDEGGGYLGHRDLGVHPYSQLQFAFRDQFPGISTTNARLSLEVIEGEGRVLAYGTGIANASQDPTTYDMLTSWPAVVHDTTLVGDGNEESPLGLADGAVTTTKLAEDSVTESKLARSSVTTVKIADGAVAPAKMDTSGATTGQVLKVGSPAHWANDSLMLPYQGVGSNSAGGALKVTNSASGSSSYGVEAHGRQAGGYFVDSDGSGYAYAGYGEHGISASGRQGGGHFADLDNSASAYVASGNHGVYASGRSAGGEFRDLDNTAAAYAGYGETGVYAWGHEVGGHFEDSNDSGWAKVGVGNTGVWGKGNYTGGSFGDLDNGTWGDVAHGTASTMGNGSKNFIQNHPHDPNRVIVYTALEGDEVATYTRGTARLIGGEARVPLGETFKWVTDPGIGLTAHLTPRGVALPLAVVSLTTEELVVRGPASTSPDVVFDFVVFGLRIGFEEASVVQEKEEQAYIPSMTSVRERYEREPELRRFTAMARFEDMRRAAGDTTPVDLSASRALRDAIVEFDPAVHAQERDETEMEPGAGHPPLEMPDDSPGDLGSDPPEERERSGERLRRDPLLSPQAPPIHGAGEIGPQRGNVVLDDAGEAWVEVPSWFGLGNSEFLYQLTCVGGFAPIYIAEGIAGNRFRIAGGDPDMKVSWQVVGVR